MEKFKKKEIKNSVKIIAGGSGSDNDFQGCVRDYCLTGTKFGHIYLQNEKATSKL